MANTLTRHWWLLVVRGIAAILFGLAAYFWPGVALTTLVLLFAAYALVDGALSMITGIRRVGNEKHWWIPLLEGLVGVIAGIAAIVYPGVTALILLYLVATWAVLTGILEIVAAVRLREEIEGEFWMGLSGLLSILFGIALYVLPGPGALAVVWLIASYAIIFGIFLIALGLRLRKSPAPPLVPATQSGD